jgi:hypothetical protein
LTTTWHLADEAVARNKRGHSTEAVPDHLKSDHIREQSTRVVQTAIERGIDLALLQLSQEFTNLHGQQKTPEAKAGVYDCLEIIRHAMRRVRMVGPFED